MVRGTCLGSVATPGTSPRASGLVAMPEDASAAEPASPMPNSAPWDIAPSAATSSLYAPVTPYSRQARFWNREATTSGALIFRFNALRTCRMELHRTEAELAVQLWLIVVFAVRDDFSVLDMGSAYCAQSDAAARSFHPPPIWQKQRSRMGAGICPFRDGRVIAVSELEPWRQMKVWECLEVLLLEPGDLLMPFPCVRWCDVDGVRAVAVEQSLEV
jgi:hypothetical protein